MTCTMCGVIFSGEEVTTSGVCVECIAVSLGASYDYMDRDDHEALSLLPAKALDDADIVEKLRDALSYANPYAPHRSPRTAARKATPAPPLPPFNPAKDLFPNPVTSAEGDPSDYLYGSPLRRTPAPRMGAACALPEIPARVAKIELVTPGNTDPNFDAGYQAWFDLVDADLPEGVAELAPHVMGRKKVPTTVTEALVDTIITKLKEDLRPYSAGTLEMYVTSQYDRPDTRLMFDDIYAGRRPAPGPKAFAARVGWGHYGPTASAPLTDVACDLFLFLTPPTVRQAMGLVEVKIS